MHSYSAGVALDPRRRSVMSTRDDPILPFRFVTGAGATRPVPLIAQTGTPERSSTPTALYILAS